VYLDDVTPEEDASAEHEPDALTSELRDRIRFLEEELRRKDAILLNMTEAMKALSPPPREEDPEFSETASEAPDRAEKASVRRGRGPGWCTEALVAILALAKL
jgi:hypothetical protein